VALKNCEEPSKQQSNGRMEIYWQDRQFIETCAGVLPELKALKI
jgi:hypothetical protein